MNPVVAVSFLIALNACGPGVGLENRTLECGTISGSPWVPDVLSASPSNHDADQSIEVVDLGKKTVNLTGAKDAVTGARLVTFQFTLADLGPGGSFTLATQSSDYPKDLAYLMPRAALVKLEDPNGNDWIALPSACLSGGLFTGTGVSPTLSASCVLSPTGGTPSAYANIDQWDQIQFPTFGGATTSTFPTCDWADANAGPITTVTPAPAPASIPCAFNNGFFSAGRVPTGTYTATFALVNTYDNNDTRAGNLQVYLYKKNNAGVVVPAQQAIDVNVILVGDTNINDSRTTEGKERLNTLFEKVAEHYSQPNTGIRLGRINVFEWSCPLSGDYYADLNYLYDGEDFFRIGSAMVSNYPKAVNLFLTSRIRASTSSALTVLGVAGAIRGSPIAATESNGVVVATFNTLKTMALDGKDMFNLSSTISHELGHYLGLNHAQESGATTALSFPKIDPIPDTPYCGMTTSASLGGKYVVQHSSCLNTSSLKSGSTTYSVTGCSSACPGYTYSAGSSNFCPTATECQFNHLMWWTTQNFDTVLKTGDGTLFSPQTSTLLKYHPYVY